MSPEQSPSIFGHDYKGRKNIPLYHFLTRYFPKALVELVKVCVAGNVQHNPELDPTDINWSRGKSTDQLNTAMRHLFDHKISGPFDEEPNAVQKIIGGRTRHLAKAAWRILAELELDIEREQGHAEAPEPELGEAGITPVNPVKKVIRNCKCGARSFTYNEGDLSPYVIAAGRTHSENGCSS